jgi:hypothetical protein
LGDVFCCPKHAIISVTLSLLLAKVLEAPLRNFGDPMAKVTIEDVEYDTDSMSDDAIANLKSIQFVDTELARLNAKISVMNTARLAYFSALQQELVSLPDVNDVEGS